MLAAKRLTDRIDRRALLKLTRSLVQIPTENPPGGEAPAVVFLEPRLRALGFGLKRVITPSGRWNLLAERGFGAPASRARRGAPGSRTFLFNGHIDVVPAGDPRAWTYPPFAGKVARKKLWGRGTADMKGGIAAFIAAIQVLVRARVRSPHRVAIHLVSDEEALGGEGTGYLTRRGLVRADLAVIGEPTDLVPALAAKGTLRGRVHVLGRAAHAATPERGVNAIFHAADLVKRLAAMKLRGRHRLLGRPTLSVGTIQGGLRSNVVPPICTLEFDRRIIPGETQTQVRREIAGVVAELKKKNPKFRAKVEYGTFAGPSEIPDDSEVVRLADDALAQLEGKRPEHGALQGTTDARFLIDRARIPTLIFGPGHIDQAHTIDEFVRVEDLERAAAAYLLMVANFLEGP
jgi:acetylornithine deacetylase/succinyl-diaminopimelate desuccinylase family protein